MDRESLASFLAVMYEYVRTWFNQRSKRRQSLRLYRLTTRAARRLR